MNEENFRFFEFKDRFLIYGKVSEEELVSFKIFDLDQPSIVGNIYRGRILKKIPSINGFFVDLGLSKNGFFQPKKNKFNNYDESDEIIFQVISNPVEEKGPKITDEYELKGNYFILQPFRNKINVSKKINDQQVSKKLIEISRNILGDSYGGIIRTKAKDIDSENFISELKNLLKTQKNLELEKNFSPTPKLLVKKDVLYNLLNLDKNIFVITNNEELYDKYKKDYNIEFDTNFSIKYTKYFPEIKKLFNKIVVLDNGIELVFEHTEAFNVIDINSKKFLDKKSDKSLDDVNINIIKDLTKQIDFRNLYGIILVDLLSFSSKKKKNLFLENLFLESKKYKNPINIIGITRLGILELTRNKSVSNKPLENIDLSIFEGCE